MYKNPTLKVLEGGLENKQGGDNWGVKIVSSED